MKTKLILLMILGAIFGVLGDDIQQVPETEPARTYPKDEDSLYYEMVGDTLKVHVMMTDSGPVRIDTLPLTLDSYLDVCEMYGIADAEIVYAQSCLESGHFTSKRFRNHNNHLGIKAGRHYASYPYWADCLRAYSKKVANKKRPGENHYAFLSRIGYAEDPDYISKVKSVVKLNRKRHKEVWERR